MNTCPRRAEAPYQLPGLPETDTWVNDQTCSYCGSLNPDVFMARVEAGDVEIGPTDKVYKAYVRNAGGAPFKQTYRACPLDADCVGPQACTHWTTREVDQTKFYFQHLSEAQQQRFIDLLNARTVKFGVPGHFYVMPFFAARG